MPAYTINYLLAYDVQIVLGRYVKIPLLITPKTCEMLYTSVVL